MTTISVLLADDHDIVRYGISTFLSMAEDIEVVGEASDGEQCLTLYRELQPDVCLLDVSMPVKDGVETAREIRDFDPNANILILSMYTDKDIIDKLLKIGIDGFLHKTADRDDLLSGIRSIMKNQQVFSREVSNKITQTFLNGDFDNSSNCITDREQEILRLVAEGNTSKEIAQKLYISPRTVDTHRSNVMQKLELNNIAELVRYAINNNLVS